MRARPRTDGNHTEIIEALRRAGIKAVSLASVGGGVPDLVVGFRGCNLLLEVKDGSLSPSRRELTSDERDWHATWPGQVVVVESPEQAINAVLDHVKEMGRI